MRKSETGSVPPRGLRQQKTKYFQLRVLALAELPALVLVELPALALVVRR